MPPKGDYLPYGHQHITDTDIEAVVKTLRSDWLTTGPAVDTFEKELAKTTVSEHAVVLSSGTAALHAAMHAIGIKAGDEVIVPPMTFAATSNAVLYCGGTPVFADVCQDTLCINPEECEKLITKNTKAIIGVDYAGHPINYKRLKALCDAHSLALISDSCHALGAKYNNKPIGGLADISVFSFHPVKPITTGEGGALTTNSSEFAARARTFRSHGITTDFKQREENGLHYYEMTELGFNYRLSDIHCALGASQLSQLESFTQARNDIAAKYDKAFSNNNKIKPLRVERNILHAYHLYVVKVPKRDEVFAALREQSIGVNVHYIPVHLHPYYKENLGTAEGLCPNAEAAYKEILSLPIFPGMTSEDIARVVSSIQEAVT